jgi:hypothetical protein
MVMLSVQDRYSLHRPSIRQAGVITSGDHSRYDGDELASASSISLSQPSDELSVGTTCPETRTFHLLGITMKVGDPQSVENTNQSARIRF